MNKRTAAVLFDRELSWLSFNERVLQEARDGGVPLLERLKFLAIYSSNLDEFFRVRVASVRSLLRLKKRSVEQLEFNPTKLLNEIYKSVTVQQEEFGDIFRNQVLPELAQKGVFLVTNSTVGEEQGQFLRDYFEREVQRHLRPVLLRKGRRPPFLRNRAIYLVTELWPAAETWSQPGGGEELALLEIPVGPLPRFVELPGEPGRHYVIFLDDVIRYNLDRVYPGRDVGSSYSVKLTRDAELYLEDEFSGNLLDLIRKSLARRETGAPSRFLYDLRMPYPVVKLLRKHLQLADEDLFVGGRYHNLSDLASFPKPGLEGLSYPPLPPLAHPVLGEAPSVLEAMREQDQLLSFPYQSYGEVVRFFDEAAADPDVEAIYVTLYRVAKQSAITAALIRAAQAGKQVNAFVEVRARFDEERNMQWAERMQHAGVRVLYGMRGGLKVHAKVALVVRREAAGRRLYAYLGTGNFNEDTARLYADHALLTCDPRLTEEVLLVFRYLMGVEPDPKFEHLLVAPLEMRRRFYGLIEDEIAEASAGRPSGIVLKVNSLEDPRIIERLYRASQAGVPVRIVVRGICRLVPGVAGLSDGIRATSIVDRFLEHARIFRFHHRGEPQLYLGSADWMQRNLSRRVEVCFPLYAPHVREELSALLELQLADNTKARVIDRRQKNTYVKASGPARVRAQLDTYRLLEARLEAARAARVPAAASGG